MVLLSFSNNHETLWVRLFEALKILLSRLLNLIWLLKLLLLIFLIYAFRNIKKHQIVALRKTNNVKSKISYFDCKKFKEGFEDFKKSKV